MFAEKFFMLEHFRKTDEVYYYADCVDITRAGENCYLNDIAFFIKDERSPLSDYIQVKKYDDNSILIGVHTNSRELIEEVVSYLTECCAKSSKIEMCSEYDEIFTYDCIVNRFVISDSDTLNPIYYMRSSGDLRDIPPDPDVSIALAVEGDRDELAAEVKAGHYNEEEMGPRVLDSPYDGVDVRIYVLRVRGRIAGYLRAECWFSNIYDIGWIQVQTEYRGNGYAALLALYFSRDCFARGYIPHYGYAVSDASARVAEKCGYTRTKRSLACKLLEWKNN